MTSIRFSRIGEIGVMAPLMVLCGSAAAAQPTIDISGLWLVQDQPQVQILPLA